jgi:hypothetical protein
VELVVHHAERFVNDGLGDRKIDQAIKHDL